MSAPRDAAEVRLHALVRGRVQGVGFRATTQMEAQRRGLAGWVRNRSDDSVELVAEGARAALEEFLAFLHRGPRTAHVDAVTVDWGPAEGAPQPFEVRRTL